jgi:NitT/TauT family transport system substrate-binding protein
VLRLLLLGIAALTLACAPAPTAAPGGALAGAPPVPAAGAAGSSAPAVTAVGAPSAPAAVAPTAPRPLIPVTIAIPATSLPFLPLHIAKQRGYDQQNGLDLQVQMIGGTTSVQAMLAGDVDFAASAGAVLNAALGGAPVVVLLIGIDTSTYVVYARPAVRDVRDLKGKVLAVDTVGGSQYTEVGLGLRQAGLDPGDVTIVSMAAPARIAALDSGAVDAAVLVPPQDVQAEKLNGGHHRLLNLADYVVGINGGLGATTTLVQAKPAVVEGMVTTVLMAVRYLKENREGTLPLIMSYMEVDAATAATIYDRSVGVFGDGMSTPAARAEIVQHAAEALKTAPGYQPADLFDLAAVERATARLQASGWRPN